MAKDAYVNYLIHNEVLDIFRREKANNVTNFNKIMKSSLDHYYTLYRKNPQKCKEELISAFGQEQGNAFYDMFKKGEYTVMKRWIEKPYIKHAEKAKFQAAPKTVTVYRDANIIKLTYPTGYTKTYDPSDNLQVRAYMDETAELAKNYTIVYRYGSGWSKAKDKFDAFMNVSLSTGLRNMTTRKYNSKVVRKK